MAMNDELRKDVEGLRGGMIGALNRNNGELPERFAILAAEQSNQVTFLDLDTGRELTTGLCNAHGAKQAIIAFFGEGA